MHFLVFLKTHCLHMGLAGAQSGVHALGARRGRFLVAACSRRPAPSPSSSKSQMGKNMRASGGILKRSAVAGVGWQQQPSSTSDSTASRLAAAASSGGMAALTWRPDLL